MRLKSTNGFGARWGGAGFTLLEVVVCIVVMSVVFISLYAALASGVSMTQMTRENLRATQILLEKAETFRLYDWDQITTKDWVPDTFTASYCPTATNTSSQGTIYSGTIKISTPSLSTNYEDDMRQVDITLSWKTGSLNRNRAMTIYVARNGMQNYNF